MKNKRGFTLVELMAVIAILAILATIATPIVLTVQRNIKEKMLTAKVKVINSAAVMCAQKTGGSGSCDTVAKLCQNGFLDVDKGLTQAECQQNPVSSASMGACSTGVEKDTTTKRWKAAFNPDDESCTPAEEPEGGDSE